MAVNLTKDTTFSRMKGLAIIAVVAGHLGFDSVETAVNYWHLAVFYFVSGYFFKDSHLASPGSFAWRRFKGLMLPFFGYALFFLFIHNALCRLGIYDTEPYRPQDFAHQIFGIFCIWTSGEPLAGAIWFLPSLFMVTMIYSSLTLLCRKAGRTAVYLSVVGGGEFWHPWRCGSVCPAPYVCSRT